MAAVGRIFQKTYTKWRYQQRRRLKARMRRNRLQKLREEKDSNVEVNLEKSD